LFLTAAVAAKAPEFCSQFDEFVPKRAISRLSLGLTSFYKDRTPPIRAAVCLIHSANPPWPAPFLSSTDRI
jgi:hypothetical protein